MKPDYKVIPYHDNIIPKIDIQSFCFQKKFNFRKLINIDPYFTRWVKHPIILYGITQLFPYQNRITENRYVISYQPIKQNEKYMLCSKFEDHVYSLNTVQ